MSTSMREALEPFAKITHGIEGNDNDVWHRHDGDVLTVGDFRRARAALAGRKQAYPEPGECDWPGCGCDPNATKVIESFLEQNWKPPLDRKAIMAALKPFAAISVYEDDDSAPVKVIVNYRISYDFTLGDFRALQSADAIMRETR